MRPPPQPVVPERCGGAALSGRKATSRCFRLNAPFRHYRPGCRRIPPRIGRRVYHPFTIASPPAPRALVPKLLLPIHDNGQRRDNPNLSTSAIATATGIPVCTVKQTMYRYRLSRSQDAGAAESWRPSPNEVRCPVKIYIATTPVSRRKTAELIRLED